MRNPTPRGFLLLCALFSSIVQAAGFTVCEENIANRSSPFNWQVVQADIPLYLLPEHARKLYPQLAQSYQVNLDPVDEQRTEVKQFRAILDKIVEGAMKPLVKVGPNPIDGSPELQIGRNDTIALNCGEISEPYLIDMIHLANSLEKIHDASLTVFRDATTAQIASYNRQYQDLFDNGLPMWPQETWLNGLVLGESDAEAPNRLQWVFMRPSIGLGLNADRGLNDGDLEETLGLEIGGFVRYSKQDFSAYWGLSLLATLGDDAGPGYGVLLRYNNFILGFTQRDRNIAAGITEDRDYYYLGLDLYDLIMRENKRFRDYKQKVRDKISALRD